MLYVYSKFLSLHSLYITLIFLTIVLSAIVQKFFEYLISGTKYKLFSYNVCFGLGTSKFRKGIKMAHAIYSLNQV